MAWLRRVPVKQSIRFTRITARNFFADVVPVDDHITGLNDTQQQVCHNIEYGTAMAHSIIVTRKCPEVLREGIDSFSCRN